jgi:hypothetical protein
VLLGTVLLVDGNSCTMRMICDAFLPEILKQEVDKKIDSDKGENVVIYKISKLNFILMGMLILDRNLSIYSNIYLNV